MYLKTFKTLKFLLNFQVKSFHFINTVNYASIRSYSMSHLARNADEVIVDSDVDILHPRLVTE